MRDELVGIGNSMQKVDTLVAAVDSLSAKLDSNSAELTAVRQTCEDMLETVRSLHRTPPCDQPTTATESAVPHIGAVPEEQHMQCKHSNDSKPASKASVGSGAQCGLQPVKTGRLTAYFRRRKPTAISDIDPAVTAERLKAERAAAAKAPQEVQHAVLRDLPSSKRSHPLQAQSPAPSKAPRPGPDATGVWRRKHSKVVYDSSFDRPNPVRHFELGRAAAGAPCRRRRAAKAWYRSIVWQGPPGVRSGGGSSGAAS